MSLLSVKRVAFIGGGIASATGAGFLIDHLTKGLSMEDELKSQGKQLIDLGEGYQDVFDFYREDEELIKLLKVKNSEVDSKSIKEFAGPILGEWCSENLKIYRAGTKTKQQINKYCTPAPENLKEKLIKEGKQVVTNWDTKLANIKSSNNALLNNLNGKNTEINKDELESWCNENTVVKNLSQITLEQTEEKATTLCFN